MDPISYVIKSTGASVHWNEEVPPRYKLGNKWYYIYPEMWECHGPAMLPVDDIQIKTIWISDIGFGKSIYTKRSWRNLRPFMAVKEKGRHIYSSRNSKTGNRWQE